MWEKQCGGNIEYSGPYGSITAIRHHNVLFNTMINYITGKIYIASERCIGSIDKSEVFRSLGQREIKRSGDLLKSICPIVFGFETSSDVKGEYEKKFVTYCEGQKYKDNLIASGVISLQPDEPCQKYLAYSIPGGPARILYLKHPSDVGFIMANGEKITEWLGWLAYVKFSQSSLQAYELSFESCWTRDGVLMAPSAIYSILGDVVEESAGQAYKNPQVDLQKLKYLKNPSKYRSTIVICHRSNQRISLEMTLNHHPMLCFRNRGE